MRPRHALPAASLALLLGACGGGPASPPALAYGLPDPASVTYLSGDTADMDIDANGQSMQARVMSAATLATTFSRADDGIQVSMTVQDLDALDRKGAATIVSQPKLNQSAQQFFQPLLMAHTFFPRLPGRGVAPGESWTDTIHAEGPQGEGQMSTDMVVTYKVAGDTMVGGRSVLRLDMDGTVDQTASGLIAGMDFTQSAAGTMTGWVLWDMRGGLMVENYTESDAKGTMDVSAAPFPLGIRVRTQSRVKLQEGM